MGEAQRSRKLWSYDSNGLWGLLSVWCHGDFFSDAGEQQRESCDISLSGFVRVLFKLDDQEK
jgi:hypothetical protein